MSDLKVDIGEDYEAETLKPLKKNGETNQCMYWVYDEKGGHKKYTEASSEETVEFAQSLHLMPAFHDPEPFELSYLKGKLLDRALLFAMIEYRNLFGGPEFWEEIPEWQRMKRLQQKERKESEK